MDKLFKCGSCKESLPASSFNKNKGRATGLSGYCRECDKALQNRRKQANPGRVSEYNRRYRESEAGARFLREYALKKNYGISLEEYDRMFEEQGGCCFICNRTPEDNKQKLSVDHCHSKGTVRRLLCLHCNTGLGRFFDNPQLLRAAADYLEEHNGRTENGCEAGGSEGQARKTEEIGASGSQG